MTKVAKIITGTILVLTAARVGGGAAGTVTVGGSVSRAGVYSISGRDVRVSEIVVGAGPVNDRVSVEVSHPSDGAAPVEVLPLTRLADLEKDQGKNLVLKPGDIVNVVAPSK